MRKTLAISLASMALFAPPAMAQDSPITSGFWAFPSSKEIVGDALADSCASGFLLQYGDGSWQSFVIDMKDGRPAMTNDSFGTCTFDKTAQVETCPTSYWEGSGYVEREAKIKYSVEADGRLRADFSDSQSTVTTYPLPCPDSAINHALKQTLAPGT